MSANKFNKRMCKLFDLAIEAGTEKQLEKIHKKMNRTIATTMQKTEYGEGFRAFINLFGKY